MASPLPSVLSKTSEMIAGLAGRWRDHSARLMVMALLMLLLPTAGQAFEWQKLNPFYQAPQPVRDPHWFSSHFYMPQTDKALVKLIKQRSLLFTETNEPVVGALGLINLAQDDFENIIGILYSRAYYGGTVEITLDGIPLVDIDPRHTFPASNKDRKIPVTVTIRPGKRFVFDQLAIETDKLTLNPTAYGLEAGGFADSDVIFQTEKAIVTQLREDSYALAEVAGRNVEADHDTTTLDVGIQVAPGSPALFGFTSVMGTARMDAEFTRYMFDVTPDVRYHPEDIEIGVNRLRNLGVFNSVTAEEADNLTANGQLPITLTVSERKPRVFGIGAEYSNTDGAALHSYWTHRNLFGHAEQLKLEGKVSRIGQAKDWQSLDYEAGATFQRPGTISPDTLYQAGITAERTTTEALVSREYKLYQQLARQLDTHRTVQIGTGLEYTSDERNGVANHYFIASLPAEARYDYRDTPLDARKGWFARVGLEPGYELRTQEPFIKVGGEVAYYQALDEDQSWVIASRLGMGSYILGGQSLPRNRRFFAGGGGSVRGYGYRRIGPEDGADVPIGGLSKIEASLELRKQVTDTIQLVPFIDIGTIGDSSLPDFQQLHYGAGVGIRYTTPIGPLRLDIAMPLNPAPNDRRFSFYAGIGQAF